MTKPEQYKVLGVQTGTAQCLVIDGREELSAIAKKARTQRIAVHSLGLEGDQQADLSAHGGQSKAVYAYPAEHYAFWQAQNPSKPLAFGALGENLTLLGLPEADVYIDDELHFPDCILRVTQPREPCYKFNAVMQDRFAAKKMVQSGFCGFYLAVVATGSISKDEHFELKNGPRQISILSLFNTTMGKSV